MTIVKILSLVAVRAAVVRVAKAGDASLAQSLPMIRAMAAGMSLPTQSVLLMDTHISQSALQCTVEGTVLKTSSLDRAPTMYVCLVILGVKPSSIPN